MTARLRDAAAPAYLLLCLILGGSRQGIWGTMLLQLLGIALIAWAALARSPDEPSSRERPLIGIVFFGLVVVAVQLIPLPPEIWQALGSRHVIAEGYAVLGVPLPWLPISVAPYDSLSTIFALIPALAILAASLRLGCRPLWFVLALVTGAFAGILLGALQVSSPDPETSPWYLYRDTNFGAATGFFANANHMASLLVITLPFLAAVMTSNRTSGSVQRYSAVVALVAGAGLVIAVGIALNGSLAGYGLSIPVLAASAMIIAPRRSGALRWLGAASAILFIAAVGWLATTPLSTAGALRASAQTSVQSREAIVATTATAAEAFMPLGSGVGSFRRVYALYEDHQRLDPTTYVNHAHNDYLELALETGIPGLIVLAFFLFWWGRAAFRAWHPADADPYARAAAVASAAILVHSLVDFPLRTAAISGCFAMCLALLVREKSRPAAEKSQLWPTRHVVAG
ncbi:MAG TPA: O-antigen ligase family protein [Sphingomicrobium sp.]|nr:O-antigen ligase family protein [Sphingomicrobium sp.]